MARDTSLTTYVESETKAQLKREADERDMTLSSYLIHLIDRGRMAEAEENLTSRTDAEAAIERVVKETVEDYHADLLAALEKSSVYSIANFELLAGSAGFDVSGARRDDVFSIGRRRTHTPLSDHDDATTADSAAGEPEPKDRSEDETTGDDDGRERGSLVDDLR